MLLERSIFPPTIDFHRETEKFTVKFIIIIAFILIDNWLTIEFELSSAWITSRDRRSNEILA